MTRDIQIYRMLGIAMQGYNMDYMARYTEPIVGTAILAIIVLSVFCVIKLNHVMEIFIISTALLIASFTLAYEILALRLMASIYESSVKYSQIGMKSIGRKTIEGKELKSFRSLRINIGSFFVESSTAFVYFDSCINHSINVLLMS